MSKKDGILRLPIATRMRFWLRLCGVRFLQALVRLGRFLHWQWLVFNVIALQRRLGWRFVR